MAVAGEVSPVEAHIAMSEALGRLTGDVRLGRGVDYPDIQFGFTTPDGHPAHEADLEAPAEDEDFIGRAELEVSAKIGDQEEASPLGRLVVTALAPGQGTGKTIERSSSAERMAGILPVSREGIHTELHVPISTLVPGRTATRVHTFVNHLLLKGFQEDGQNGHIITLGSVGQSPAFFERTIEGDAETSPHPIFTLVSGLQHGKRISLFNASEVTQLAGTLALYEQPTGEADDFLHNIMPSFPVGNGTERVAVVRSGDTAVSDLETLEVPPHPAVVVGSR